MQEAAPLSQDRGLRHTVGAPRIAYRVHGDGSHPVVLLHGVGSSSRTWWRLVPALDEGLRLVLPDYRGHGDSEAPAPPYRPDHIVDDIVRVLDAEDIGAASVIGFSVGALFAQQLALAHPERVNALVLLNSIADRTPQEQLRALSRWADVRTRVPGDLARSSVERWFTSDFARLEPAVVDVEVQIVSGVDPVGYAEVYGILATADLGDSPARIACPTLIVTGENDRGSTPRMSRTLHELIPDSRLHIFPDLQHYLHVEDPARLAAMINDFLLTRDTPTAL
jgi:pimeloyl-ACP methyl ester carboxylesterase